MARRKKTKRKSKGSFFNFGSSKKRSRKSRKAPDYQATLIVVGKVLLIITILAAIAVGFVFMDRYVKKAVPVQEKTGLLELSNVPEWVNEHLKQKIYSAAIANTEDLKLDEDAAASVQQNIQSNIAWLDNVTVKTTHESILISARWRKPIALIHVGRRKFYVDSELFVLDYLPVPSLPIVEVKGMSSSTIPTPGNPLQLEDLAAAIDILTRLNQMDLSVTPEKPLLFEIASISVRNFNGRKSSRKAHIILYTKDNTEIIWGAEFGKWQRYMESNDQEKLAKLYGYYKENGTLLNSAKYINLRDPQNSVPRPIDKY